MSTTSEIIEKLEALTRFIGDAHTALNEGAVVDLSYLDGEVAKICEETLSLPAQEAAKVQPIMGEMITKLEALGVALQDFQSHMKSKVE